MIASLPMYDLPDCRAANDRYWARIRDRVRAAGGTAPDAISRELPDLMAHWQRPDLVLSQTCGFPFRAVLKDKVTLVGTLDFGLDGCPPGYYHSVFVARADDPRKELVAFKDARFAYNDPLSQSGWAAPQIHAAGLGFQFSPDVRTGGHALSARAVLDGEADIASLDAVTWRLCLRNNPGMRALKVVDRTEPTPGLPYIAALGADQPMLLAALEAAIAALDPADRAILGIVGVLYIPAERYLAVPTPAAPAALAR